VRTRRLLIILGILAVVAAVALALRTVQKGKPLHAADDARAPGSVDAWPSVPRNPGG